MWYNFQFYLINIFCMKVWVCDFGVYQVFDFFVEVGIDQIILCDNILCSDYICDKYDIYEFCVG